MKHLTATDAARHFSDVLDGVEHIGETFVVTRHGAAVARIEPIKTSSGKAAKEILAARPADRAWAEELRDLRGLLMTEGPRWNG